MFGTTKHFLDYFGLKKLEDLPPLADLSDWETLRIQLDLPEVEDESEPDLAEMAEVTELPGIPVEEADEVELDAEALAQAESLADSGFEEIIASEWPDPIDDDATPTDVAVPNQDKDDPDASVGGA